MRLLRKDELVEGVCPDSCRFGGEFGEDGAGVLGDGVLGDGVGGAVGRTIDGQGDVLDGVGTHAGDGNVRGRWERGLDSVAWGAFI